MEDLKYQGGRNLCKRGCRAPYTINTQRKPGFNMGQNKKRTLWGKRGYIPGIFLCKPRREKV